MKVLWSKFLGHKETDYNHDLMSFDVRDLCNTLAERLTSNIIFAADKYNEKVLSGHLV